MYKFPLMLWRRFTTSPPFEPVAFSFQVELWEFEEVAKAERRHEWIGLRDYLQEYDVSYTITWHHRTELFQIDVRDEDKAVMFKLFWGDAIATIGNK